MNKLTENLTEKSLVLEDSISTKGIKTTCSSKALESYTPIFNATLVELLLEEGYTIGAKSTMPEFGVGEGEYDISQVVKGTDSLGIMIDTGGEMYKAIKNESLYGLVTSYGLVSRYGLIPSMSSSLSSGLIGENLNTIINGLKVISKKDIKDSVSVDVELHLDQPSKNIEIKHIDETDIKDLLEISISVYDILFAGEFATNMERIDGIVVGHRSPEFSDIDSLYKNSRSESLGEEVKKHILLGNYLLLEGNYDCYYEQAMRARTMIYEKLTELLKEINIIEISEEYLKMVKLVGLPYGVSKDGKIYTTKHFNEKDLVSVLGGR